MTEDQQSWGAIAGKTINVTRGAQSGSNKAGGGRELEREVDQQTRESEQLGVTTEGGVSRAGGTTKQGIC